MWEPAVVPSVPHMTPSRSGALALTAGPGLLLAAHLVQLTPSAHDTASELASLDAAPARALAATMIGFAGVVLTVAGLASLAAALRVARPRTADVGMGMSFVGGFGLVALLGSSPLMVSLAQSSGPRSLLVGVADRYEGSWVSAVWVGLMLLGWSLGPVVLGVGLWRAGGTWVVPALLAVGLVLTVLG